MKPIDQQAFDRNSAEAAPARELHDGQVIRTVMNRNDWLILATLALIWGGAFFFIGVAVRHVPPLTYVWLRLTIAAAAMWLFVRVKGHSVGLPREVWGSILLLALLNNALPFALFGWGQTHQTPAAMPIAAKTVAVISSGRLMPRRVELGCACARAATSDVDATASAPGLGAG